MSVDDRIQKTKLIVMISVSGLFVAWMAMVFALRQMWAESGGAISTPLAAASRTPVSAGTATRTAVAALTPAATRTMVGEATGEPPTPSGAGHTRQGGGGQVVAIVIAGLLTLILGSIIGWLAGWLVVARQGGGPPRWLWGRVLLAAAALAVVLFALVLSPAVDLSPASARGAEAVAQLTPTPDRDRVTPQATYTTYPTSTPYPTATPYPTGTPVATYTPYPTYTPFPTSTPTRRPTSTPTEAPTQAPTATLTEAPTQTPTATLTEAPTQTPTATPTREPTSTAVRASELPTTGASLSGIAGLATILVLFALLIGSAVWEARQPSP